MIQERKRVMTPSEVMRLAEEEEAKRVHKVRVTEDGVFLAVYPGGNEYPIYWEQLTDAGESLVWWVRHLLRKPWCDRDLCKDFIDAVTAHYRKGK